MTDLNALLRRAMGGEDTYDPWYAYPLGVLWTLYDRVLRVSPDSVDDPDRDRLLLSKGHGAQAYYCVLAAKGFIPPEWLDDVTGPTSRLGGHPDGTLVPGIEIGSGSLGHGLGIGVGIALGLRAQGRLTPRVYVVTGDAELDEGSNQEAIAYAGIAGLDSVTAVVLDNHSARWSRAGLIADYFATFGWDTTSVDGHDPDAVEKAALSRTPGRPSVVVVELEEKA
jgi:transketolase